jgi:hypothetical protein
LRCRLPLESKDVYAGVSTATARPVLKLPKYNLDAFFIEKRIPIKRKPIERTEVKQTINDNQMFRSGEKLGSSQTLERPRKKKKVFFFFIFFF